MAALGTTAFGYRRNRFSLIAMTLFTFALTAGCGAETGGRVPIAGNVTLDGAPLARGTIEFHPKGEGSITGGTIRDGRFEIPASKGALPGQYEVRIFATDEAGQPMDDPNAPPGESDRPVQPELIDARYNLESELTADIGEDGNTNLSFDLEA